MDKATKQKALFVNRGFTKRIIGLKDEESEALLQLLFKVSWRDAREVCVIHIRLAHSQRPGFPSAG